MFIVKKSKSSRRKPVKNAVVAPVAEVKKINHKEVKKPAAPVKLKKEKVEPIKEVATEPIVKEKEGE